MLDDALYENVVDSSEIGVSSQHFLDNERQNHYDIPNSKPLKVAEPKIHNGQCLDDSSEHIYETFPGDASPPKKTESTDQFVEMSTPNIDLEVSPVTPEIMIEKILHEHCQNTSNQSDVMSCYEFIEPEVDKPSLGLEIKSSEDTSKSVKNRMFLSTDDAASTLLFTQTVTSPMLTPSEENIDFLKGFQRDSQISNESSPESKRSEENSTSESPVVSKSSENVYENDDETKENIYENVKSSENIFENMKSSENIYENIKTHASETEEHEEHIYQDIDDCKKESVYEDVADVKTVTSQMISDEIMVENSLYNTVDEVKMRQIENMIIDSEKIMYETINSQEGSTHVDQPYETILKHSEVVISHSATAISSSESPHTDQDVIEIIDCGIIENHNDESNSKENVNENNTVVTDIVNECDILKQTEAINRSVSSKSPIEETGKGDGLPKQLVDGNRDEDKESYSEFIHHSKTESNYYEKYAKVVSNSNHTEICNREKDTETVPPEIVKMLKNQFLKNTVDETSTKKEVSDVNQLKAINIMKQINKFENKDCGHEPEDVSDNSFIFKC